MFAFFVVPSEASPLEDRLDSARLSVFENNAISSAFGLVSAVDASSPSRAPLYGGSVSIGVLGVDEE